MKIKTLSLSLLASIFALGATSLTAQDEPTRPGPRANRHEPVKLDLRKLNKIEVPAEVQSLIDQFKAASDTLRAERRAAIEGLADATTEERKAAIQALRETQKEQIAAQRELAKQIREEVRALREARRDAATEG